MAQSLQLEVLVLLAYLPLSVEDCRHRDACIVVVEAVKTILGIEILELICLGIPLLFNFLEIPTLGVVDIGRDIDVVQEVERCLHGDSVLNTITHILQRLACEDVALLGLHRVGHLGRVAH